MTPPLQTSAITDAITGLYRTAKVSRPSSKHSIVPLGELVGSYNLSCVELPNLTSQRGLEYLIQHGALIEPMEQGGQVALAGFLYAYSDFGCIFVEREDLVVRRRFSVAHELGHYLLHFRPLLDDREANSNLTLMETAPQASSEDEESDGFLSGHVTVTLLNEPSRPIQTSEHMEREANQFAAELLMPASLLEELVTHYSPAFQGEDLIWRLSTEMLVSRAAMRWRLQSLRLPIAGEPESN